MTWDSLAHNSYSCADRIHCRLRRRMGVITIKTMMPPIATIPSVEPISETPSGWGVVVSCVEMAVTVGCPCIAGCVDGLMAPLNNARLRHNPNTNAGRTSLFIG